ncbi:sensor histidine kinase [Hyphococcus sp.]|uniref:sensor histidine kinase n=1 Tax=Hyphococcus sp. TaxID=2038636 RepID=UPI003CCC178A
MTTAGHETDCAPNVLIIGDVPVNDSELIKTVEDPKQSGDIIRVQYSQECLAAISQHSVAVCVVNQCNDLGANLETLEIAHERGWRGGVIVINDTGAPEPVLSGLAIAYKDFLRRDEITPALLARSIDCALARHEIQIIQKDRAEQIEALTSQISLINANAGSYVNMLAHDLRTPLSVIKQFAAVMQGGLLGDVNEEQRDYLHTIACRADDLNILLNDLLQVTRLEQAALDMRRKPATIGLLAGQPASRLEEALSREEINLTFDHSGNVPIVYCDHEKIEKAVSAITLYSSRIARAGGTVGLRIRQDLSRSNAVIDISNDGHAIPDDRLLHFNQNLSCAKRNKNGGEARLGLGLYIAKELVRYNLGDITVRNDPAGGSVFSISIPLFDPLQILTLYKERLALFNRTLDHISLVHIVVSARLDADGTSKIDDKIQHAIRSTDLVFQPSETQWLLVLPTRGPSLEGFTSRIDEIIQSEISDNTGTGAVISATVEKLGAWSIQKEYDAFHNMFAAAWGEPAGSSAFHAGKA